MSEKDSKKTLVIVESPTKADTIRKYLPKNYTVVASKGHVRDLPEDHMAIDIEHGFQPQYIITEGKESLIKDLKKKLKASEELLLATDEDREGESISWHLVQLLKPSVPYRRMVFHEITRSAIYEALKGGRDINQDLVKAQEDRRIVDRLYGYEVSPVLWRKLSNKKLSGGRVQSVGLRFIVEKELERLSHKATCYYDIRADFGSFSALLESADGQRIAVSKDFDSITGEFNNKARLLTQEDCRELVSRLESNPQYTVISVMTKESVSNPQAPFITSTLQQAASSRLHLSSRETMRIAQSLFENGFITYMRTDSVNLSEECINAARNQIENEFGTQYLSPEVRHFRNKSKNAQEAHEAIRPAGDVFRRPEETGLKGKELALYTLIWVRTLATQMASARKCTTTIKLRNGECIFSTSGTSVLFPGYLKAYAEDKDENEKNQILPPLKEGETLSSSSVSFNSHVTNPPARYSEASLIKKLEEQGIGRPSTYATIISTLLDRGYVREQDRLMIPTFMGFAVSSCMSRAFSQLVDYSYTSDMEDELDKIAEGKEDSQKYLADFYFGDGRHKGLKAMVEEARYSDDDYKTIKLPHLSPAVRLSDGRECSYTIKIGPFGTYIATDLEKEDGKPLFVNIPQYSLPGLMTDADIVSLVDEAVRGPEAVSEDRIVLKKGQRGDYWQKGERICSVPRGKKKAEDYSEEEIEYLLSLPLSVGSDEEGNEIVLNKGPYGFYLKYKDENYKLFAVPFRMTEEEALSQIGKKKPSSSAVRTFDDIDGKSVSIRKGKWGPYLKWGNENIRLPKKDISQFTEDEIRQLCSAAGEEKKDGQLGLYEDKPVSVNDGRYGKYLKWNGKNYRIPRSQNGDLTLDEAIAIISAASQEKTSSVLGKYEGKDVQLVSGRYGWYLKCGEQNYRIQQKLASSITLDDAIAIMKKQDEERSIKPVSLGSYEGEEISILHGRYGYYLKHGRDNYALPSSYRQNADGLTFDEAVSVIKKKKT